MLKWTEKQKNTASASLLSHAFFPVGSKAVATMGAGPLCHLSHHSSVLLLFMPCKYELRSPAIHP